MSISSCAVSTPGRAAMREGAMTVGGVDQNIDFAADFAGERPAPSARRSGRAGRSAAPAAIAQRLEARRFLPGLGFADPDQVGARRRERAHHRLAERGLAVGDQDFSPARIAGHFAQLRIVSQIGLPPSGTATSTAWPARSSCRFDAHARTAPRRRAVQIGDHDSRRQSRRTSAERATAGARGRTVPGHVTQHVFRSQARRGRPATRHTSRCDRQARQASRGGYCTVPQSRQTCSSNRPRAAAAVRPSATRLRVPGGRSRQPRAQRADFCAAAGCGIGRCSLHHQLRRGEHSGAAANAAIVIDHAEARDQAMPRVGNAGAGRLPGELADGLDEAEMSAGRAGLPDRQLAARRVERETARRPRRCCARMKSAPSPLPQKPRPSICSSVDDRIVVVGLQKIDILRADAGLRVKLVAVERPAAAVLNRIVRKGIVPLDGAEDARIGQAELFRRRCAACTRNPSAPAHGMTQSNSRSGSAIGRAFRYSSSVSGFLNSASGNFSALLRCATHSLPKSSRVAP